MIKELATANGSLRNGFGDALVELGNLNSKVVVITADLKESTRATTFAERFPERFFDVGVAEQNMMGVAAGLAQEGFIPFCTSFAVFNPGRNWDQLRVSVCYDNANVKIIGAHAGLTAGGDGATHLGLEDLAITRVLPNLVVLAPADIHETRMATLAAAAYAGPVYIRFGRSDEPIIFKPGEQFSIGKAKVMREGRDIALYTTGSMLAPTLAAAAYLDSNKVKAAVIHFPTVKPLDKTTAIEYARQTKAVVTVEEHQVDGGFGSAISEVLSENWPVPLKRMGVNNTFGETGSPVELRRKHKLQSSDIAAAAVKLLLKHR
ncbi:MAG: transketolase C-terminal domain-containing protein [bacterium]|nr:transketolase C-terminal domain-containing protein [bacterium]